MTAPDSKLPGSQSPAPPDRPAAECPLGGGQPMHVSAQEIDAARSERGGWSRETLSYWNVPWPPPRGWRKALIEGQPVKAVASCAGLTPSARAERMAILEYVRSAKGSGDCYLLAEAIERGDHLNAGKATNR